MCHFITLIAPSDQGADLAAVMERHGRAATPIDNPAVGTVLREGEHQFLTTRGHCDCGTILASRHASPEAFEESLAKETARLRRKGWSEAKVARAIEGRRKADMRPSGGADSIESWSELLRDLRQRLGFPYVGLLVRFYEGSVGSERFSVTRREIPAGTSLNDALASVAADEVTIFRLN